MAAASQPDPERMTRGARRGFAFLALLMIAVGAAAVVASVALGNSSARAQAATIARLNATIAQLRAQQLAACAFAADLGSIPLPDKPRPTRVGVSIFTDSRAWWHRNDCPGTLPVPPGLAKWAAYYRIPVS